VTAAFANSLKVTVNGSQLPDTVAELLVAATIEDSRNLPDAFTLRFRDPARTVISAGSFTIGAKVTLGVFSADAAAETRVLDGELTALEVEQDARGSWTVVRGYDASHRLTRGRTVASYQQMTASDIVRKVAQRAQVPVGKIDSTRAIYPQIAQPNVSDWDFLEMLARDHGAELAVTSGKLEFVVPTQASEGPAPSTPPAQEPRVLAMGANLRSLRAVVRAAQQVGEVEVRSWDVDNKKAFIARTPAKTTTSAQLSTTPGQVVNDFGAQRIVCTDTPFPNQQACDTAAKAVAEQVAGSFAEVEAVAAGDPTLRSGTAIALAGVGPPFEGQYVITTSRHVFDPVEGYETWLTVSGVQDRSLLGLTRGDELAGAGPLVGVVPGLVTDIKDPDHLGRVKVTFPWLDDTYCSDWARTLQLGGVGGGGMVGPEVGDEVLCAFEQGHLDRAFVIGGLYSLADKPAANDVPAVDGNSGKVSRRSFASRSGHRLELLDKQGGPLGVRVLTGDGKLLIDLDQQNTSILVHSDGTIVIDTKKTVAIKAGQGASIDAGTGKLELIGQSVSLTAKSGVKVDGGGGAVDVASSTAVNVKGTTVSVAGQTSAEVKSSGVLTVQGSLVKIN